MPAMIFRISIILLVLGLFSGLHAQQEQADAENCNLCHGLAFLGLTDSEGGLQNFEVSAGAYSHSIHRNVVCRDCHTDINQFPHPENPLPVDCGKACHVSRPFALTGFSHADQVESHALSAHGFSMDNTTEQNAAKPDCKYCHDNAFGEKMLDIELQEEMRHCIRCHEDEGISGVIMHVNAHSGHRSADASISVVELCSSCHANQAHMMDFDVNLTQVGGFERHFHGKALKRGLDEVANCMDCHRNHLNLPADDPNSSIHPNNIQMTCGSASYCHPNATSDFTLSAIHSEPTMTNNPIVFWVEWGFILLTAGVMALLFFHIILDFGRWAGDTLTERRKRS